MLNEKIKEANHVDLVEDKKLNIVAPFVDIFTSKEGYQIFLDMPGVSKSDFKVKIDNDELIVSGELVKDDKKQILYNEIYYNGFNRRFILPDDVDVEKISATYENGVLKLTLHKKEEFKPKYIEIN